MPQTKDFDWLFMCRQCKHYVQADSNAIGCQLKYCEYEPRYDAERFRELEESLSSILGKSQLPKGCHLFVVESEDKE